MLTDQLTLGTAHQRNSIRHLAVAADGAVAFAMQWQGDLTADLPLAGVDQRAKDSTVLFDAASVRKMQGYLGSIAFEASRQHIAVTSPRSGILQTFGQDGLIQDTAQSDVCGVAATDNGFIVTSGTGMVRTPLSGETVHNLAWDNHLVAI